LALCAAFIFSSIALFTPRISATLIIVYSFLANTLASLVSIAAACVALAAP